VAQALPLDVVAERACFLALAGKQVSIPDGAAERDVPVQDEPEVLLRVSPPAGLQVLLPV
jgi:hypothetical protein